MLKSRWTWLAIALFLIVAGVVSCNLLEPKPPENQGFLPNLPPVVDSIHLTVGNPSNATTNAATSPNNYLLVKPQYVISYNNSKHVPNWASWQLNKAWTGTLPRRNDFRPDTSLPPGWYQVKSADYSGSGYDRGHMTPSADRDGKAEDMAATYFMTNILPQAPDNNQGPWANLEQYSRSLANAGKELYIIAGGYGEKAAISKSAIKIIPPARTWKVIVVVDKPGLGIAGVTDKTRVIAVDMPNEQGIKDTNWRKFRVSVRDLEQKTQYNFLSNLPEAIQQTLETRVDQVTDQDPKTPK
jgi:endonuclease G, mitochondrial